MSTEEDVSSATVVDASHGMLHIAYQPYIFMHIYLTMFKYNLLIQQEGMKQKRIIGLRVIYVTSGARLQNGKRLVSCVN